MSGEDVGEARAGADAHQAGRGLHRFLRHVGAGMRRHAAGGAQDVAAAVSAGAGEDCPEDHPRHGNDEGPAGEPAVLAHDALRRLCSVMTLAV